MCQYCLSQGASMSCKDDVFLPLITRLRHFSKLFSSSRHGKRKNMDRKGNGSNTDASEQRDTPIQLLPDVISQCLCDESHNFDEQCSSPIRSSQQQKPRCRGTVQPFHLEKDGIRVLMFRECDTRGRKLLYDSKTVVQVPVGDTSSSSSTHSGKTFKGSTAAGGSWSSGTSVGAGGAGVLPIARSPSPHHTAITTSPATNTKTSNPKSERFAEISGGYGYQVSHICVLSVFLYALLSITYRYFIYV